METSSRALVYLERNPSPMRSPVKSQCQENWGLFSNASQKVNIAASQKKIDNASIVITNAPMLKMGVTFSAMTAHRPAGAVNSRRGKKKKSRLVPGRRQ